MGLDMYLSASFYVSNFLRNDHPEVLDVLQRTYKTPQQYINGGEKYFSAYVDIQVAYWRKANAIHKWFVDNVQNGQDDCKSYYVSRDDLANLLNLCKQVKDSNYKKAPQLLPSQSGFFFGSTEYDEWYVNDIESTISMIEEALKIEDCNFYYKSSW